jgi:hypothetical protein
MLEGMPATACDLTLAQRKVAANKLRRAISKATTLKLVAPN